MTVATALVLIVASGLVALAAGLPLYAGLAGAGVLAMVAVGIDPAVAALEIHRLESMPTLVMLPLFVLAGVVLSQGSAPRRLLFLLRESLAWLPGGPAVGMVIAATLFTAFSGASGLTIVALGGVLLPSRGGGGATGRQRRRTIGAITAAGSPGLLLAPSVPVIVYALTAQVSVERLYRATLLPALLMMLLLCVIAALRSPTRARPIRWRRLLLAARANAWLLPLPPAVYVAVFTGVVALSEVAVLTASYVLLGALLRGDVRVRRLPAVLAEAGMLSAVILIVVAAALVVSNVLVDQLVPQRLLATLGERVTETLPFLLLLNLVLLAAGMFFDIFSAIVVLVPLLAPVAIRVGVDPLHLGAVFLVNLEVGYLTPPVGINLFIARLRFGHHLVEIYRAALPFLVVMLLVLAVVTYLPAIVLR